MHAGTEPDVLPVAQSRTWLLALTLATLIPRAVVFFVNENLYGDAVVRTELAQAWLQSPHWIFSFADGARQFGPLHLYLVGLVLWLWPSPEHAGRVLSLVLGVASVIPLAHLTERLFNRRAAIWAAFGFSVWGLHIQMSTTAGSEALSLFLVLWTLVYYERARSLRQLGPLLVAAFFMNLACATRYDIWLLMPLLCIVFFIQSKDKVASATMAVVFGFACLPFPLVWMYGNETQAGHPLAPLHFIDEFHHTWSVSNVAHWGWPAASAQGLFFWPAIALVTLSPLVAFFGIWGLIKSYRERPDLRWLFWLIVVPSAYFSLRGALLTFVPLARFAVTQLALLLPFVDEGFESLNQKAAPWRRSLMRGLTVALAIAMPLALGLWTLHAESPLRNAVRPISPISTNPVALMDAARWVKSHLASEEGRVLIDSDDSYSDLQLIFFSGLVDPHWIRRRWEDHSIRRHKYSEQYVLLLPGGVLSKDPDVHLNGDTLETDGRHFVQVPDFPGPQRLYRWTGAP
jgi:4-amino-4-deoxy-L-arabinose transferase-like glycosyltransferase